MVVFCVPLPPSHSRPQSNCCVQVRDTWIYSRTVEEFHLFLVFNSTATYFRNEMDEYIVFVEMYLRKRENIREINR